MSSSIKLKNASSKTLSITNSNANQTDKEVIYLNTVDELANASGSINAVAIVSDLSRGGTFEWSATGTANGGTIFAGVSGYWTRQYDGAVNVKWFGAKGDGVTDDTLAIQTVLNLFSSTVYIPKGTFICNIEIKTQTSIIGDTRFSTILKPYIKTLPILKISCRPSTNTFQYAFNSIKKLGFISDNTVGGVGLSIEAEAPYVVKGLDIDELYFSELDTGIYAKCYTVAGEIYQLTSGTLYFEKCLTNALNINVEQSSFRNIFIDELGEQPLLNKSIISGSNIDFGHFYTSGSVLLLVGNSITFNLLRFENVTLQRAPSYLLKSNINSLVIASINVQTCGAVDAPIPCFLEPSLSAIKIGAVQKFGTNYITDYFSQLGLGSGYGPFIDYSDLTTAITITNYWNTWKGYRTSKKLKFGVFLNQGWFPRLCSGDDLSGGLEISFDTGTVSETYAGKKFFQYSNETWMEYSGTAWKTVW